MSKIKQFLVFLKNLLTPLTKKAAVAYLEKNGYKVSKVEAIEEKPKALEEKK